VELYHEKKSQGFEIVSINVQYPNESLEETADFQQKYGADFAVLLNKTRMDVAKMYGVSATPTNVVIDRDGNIVQKILGADMNKLSAALRRGGLEM